MTIAYQLGFFFKKQKITSFNIDATQGKGGGLWGLCLPPFDGAPKTNHLR